MPWQGALRLVMDDEADFFDLDDDIDVDDELSILWRERVRRRSDRPAQQVDPEELRKTRFGQIAESIRARYHPKQRAFFWPGHLRPRWRGAALTTRQSGKTSGENRESFARCLSIPGYRFVYCNATRAEAIKRCWRNDSQEGWLDLIKEFNLAVADNRKQFDKGHGDCVVNEQLLTIDFRNGSQLDIFAADDEKSGDKLRGFTKDAIAIDEAQKFPFLKRFVNSVVKPALAKRDGELWLTGTPDEFLDGLFFEITRTDDLSQRIPGWEVHEWSVLDNPGFGATVEERYERTIGSEIKERNLDPNNLPPDVVREWFGKWVTSSARYVYRVQHLSDDQLVFAPARVTSILPLPVQRIYDRLPPTPGEVAFWYDHDRALLDLPLKVPGYSKRRIPWRFALGSDFGYWPHPFAVVLWAWSPILPDIFEMFSWKRTRIYPDWQRDILRWFWDSISDIDFIVADPGGQAGANIEGWIELTGLPITPAEKTTKATWMEMFNNEIAAGRVHYRGGDWRVAPLLDEHRHLLWKPIGNRGKFEEHAERTLSDGRTPGNDCSDAGLYPYRHLVGRKLDAPTEKPTCGTEAYIADQERVTDLEAETAHMFQEAEEGEEVPRIGRAEWYEY